MLALRLIRLIEEHCDQIATAVAARVQSSPHASQMQKVGEPELTAGLQELLQHLSEWLLTKTEADIEKRYMAIADRRAKQGVPFSDCCWATIITKEYLWDYLQKQGFLRNPIELYGEMELLSLLDQFFDRAICYMAEGYQQSAPAGKEARKKQAEFNAAAFVP
jgi:hypothetical protein